MTTISSVRGILFRYGQFGQLQVLMVQRTDTKEWEFPGGGLKAQETPRQAMEREVWEETGYQPDAALLIFKNPGIRPDGQPSGREQWIYATAQFTKTAHTPDPQEICDYAWVDLALIFYNRTVSMLTKHVVRSVPALNQVLEPES